MEITWDSIVHAQGHFLTLWVWEEKSPPTDTFKSVVSLGHKVYFDSWVGDVMSLLSKNKLLTLAGITFPLTATRPLWKLINKFRCWVIVRKYRNYTIVQSSAYLKHTVSPCTVISKSFRKVLNKYALLTLPCVVPLQSGCKESQFYSLSFGQAVASMYQPTSHFS